MLNFSQDALDKVLDEGTESYAECQRQIQKVRAKKPAPFKRELKYLKNSIAEIDAIKSKTVELLDRSFKEQRIKAYKETRLFKQVHKIDQECHDPDKLWTMFIVVGCIVLEGTLAGATYAMDGKTTLIGGVGYGLSFALVNVLLGILIGFFPLRYLLKYTHRSKPVWKIKAFSSIALGVLIALLTILVFSAARVRITGSHEEIFNFASVGLFGTFNDGLSLVILGLAVIGSIVSIYEGYQGLSDPFPGYSKITHYPSRMVDKPAQHAVDNAQDRIEYLYDQVSDDVEETMDEAEDDYEDQLELLDDLHQMLIDHNALIVRLVQESELIFKTNNFVEQSDSPFGIDIADLHIPIDETLDAVQALDRPSPDFDDALNRLKSAFEDAISEIHAAHADFLSTFLK